MFKFNRVTRTFRNADNGSGNQTAAFNTGSSPFQQSGSNIFEQMQKPANSASDTSASMTPPNMNNGMPANSAPLPNNVVQGHQQASNIVPNQAADPTLANQGGSPLDNFMPVKDNNNIAPQPAAAPAPAKSIFDTDMKGWEGAMKNVDLAAGVTPEQIALATGGDANALMDIIQQVARTSMHNSAYMSTRVAGSGMNAGMKTFGETVPGMIDNHQYSNMWKGDAVMNHKSAQPMVTALTTQFRGQFPQATPQEIQAQVQEYFTTFSDTMKGQQAAAAPQAPVEDNVMKKFFE